jgi:hypothetical protein
MPNDAANAEHADGDEPDRHDGPKQRADTVGALRLQRENGDQDEDR